MNNISFDLSNKPLNRGHKKIDPKELIAYLEEHPDAYQKKIAKHFDATQQGVAKALKRLKITWKKKTLTYKEQRQELVDKYNEKIKDIPKDEIVYVDETGIDTCLIREYGYAPKGIRVHGKTLGRKYNRTNVVVGKQGKEIIAPLQYDCTMESTLFEGWFEQYLLPCLKKGTTIVMDNAKFHRKKKLLEISKKHDMNLIFLHIRQN